MPRGVLLLYVAMLVLGGGLLAMQSLGDHDSDTDGFDGDGDGVGGDHMFWLPLFSLRFWAFALTGAGAVGVLGRWLTHTSPLVLGLVSGASGLVVGAAVSLVLRQLHHAGASSHSSLEHGRGQVGRVTLRIDAGGRGKVRVELKGQMLDLIARSDESLEAGAEVVVTDLEGTEAWVTRMPKPD